VPKGILLVQSRPASTDEIDTYHRWYDETHVPEMLGVDGFVSARRLAALDDGSFAVVYEVADVEAAKAAFAAFGTSGNMSPPAGVQMDPRPTVQWFTDLAPEA
jgi:hypothetical protein